MSSHTDDDERTDESVRFEQFDVERIALWIQDMDTGIIKQFEQDGGWTIEINGDLAVIEEHETE